MWSFYRRRERNSDLPIQRASAADIDNALANLLAPAFQSGLEPTDADRLRALLLAPM
jgi:hypothetical protein